MKNIVLLSGSSHPYLAELVCQKLDVNIGSVTLGHFSNGETNVKIGESVRDRDVYIVQSAGSGNLSDQFIELCIMIHACKIASASKVTAVIPCFPYSAQPETPFTLKQISQNALSDHQEDLISRILTDSSGYRMWSAQSGKLIANLLVEAGTDHIITLDLHDPQFPGFFDIPVDNLFSQPLIVRYIRDHIPDYRRCVIVSPDAGGTKRASAIATALGSSFALVHKERKKEMEASRRLSSRTGAAIPSKSAVIVQTPSNLHDSKRDPEKGESSENDNILKNISDSTMMSSNLQLVGSIKDKFCIIIDDLADTCTTIAKASEVLLSQGASRVMAIVTHGIFSGDALETLSDSGLSEIIVSNSVKNMNQSSPDDKESTTEWDLPTPKASKLASGSVSVKSFDISGLFAEAIRRIHNGESVSMLFDNSVIY